MPNNLKKRKPIPKQYVKKALDLARDIGGLTALRRNLRDTLNTSPLCNGVKFTSDLENIYRDMWKNWCEKQAGG